MHRSVSFTAARALAATLALTIAAGPALARVHVVHVRPDGRFQPKRLSIASGDIVEWRGLGPTDAVARLSAVELQAVFDASGPLDRDAVCGNGDPDRHDYVLPDNPYRQAYQALDDNELTGPDRRGLSGVWALAPEGGEVSRVEIPSDEADAIRDDLLDGVTAAMGCVTLIDPSNDIPLDDDPRTGFVGDAAIILYHYAEAVIETGDDSNRVEVLPRVVTDPDGVDHVLCNGTALLCRPNGTFCDPLSADPARPETIPPGTYLNGLMTSTYENPDITGVVLRVNWNDLQYDDGTGTIVEQWTHLDRELERAVAHGKLVTFDVRAGMFGTPDWIFTDYLRHGDAPDPAYAAPWCDVGEDCHFTDAPAGAGEVRPLTFLDHYDEIPPGDGCGSPVRIGAPGDDAYLGLYREFIARLATHVASDTRWWQAVAHVKVSGANLRTSEAELPHHCNDDFVATADHVTAPKDTTGTPLGDRVLDVFKTLTGTGQRLTVACACNPKLWRQAGYVPQDLYDYYAGVEAAIVDSFFGEKSFGYQLIQDGFPRADATDGQSFFGDHLYRETLVDSGLGYDVNEGFDDVLVCTLDYTATLPRVDEDRDAGTAEYCSADSLLDPPGTQYLLALDPLLAADGLPDLAAFDRKDDDSVRYPSAFEQTVEVMRQAGDGVFAAFDGGAADPVAGKLFVPQHSGIQPLPQEGFELGFRTNDSAQGCTQQLLPRSTAGWPDALIAAVGDTVADFPMLASAHANGIHEGDVSGCPNQWAVDQGKDRELVTITVDPPGPRPPRDVQVPGPPQVTGFQTTNGVRRTDQVESALFNLVYNSNGVFIELYEDSLWRIARSRGTGPDAITLDDPAAPVRLATDDTDAYTVCDPAVSCYSKNLYQWANELHLRRARLAELYASFGGTTYPGFQQPFPRVYRRTFTNDTDDAVRHAYINPNRCDPDQVDPRIGHGPASALAVIEVAAAP